MKEIFERYASGFGLAAIAKALNELHVPPPMGDRLGWCPTAIRDILRRDLYRGIIWWNRTQTIQRNGTKTERQRPQSDWLRLEAPELRIVSDQLWRQIESRRQRNHAAYHRGPQGRLVSRPTGEDQRSRYLLSSLAKCVTCGGSIVAISRGRHGRSGATLYRCACYHKRGKAVCSNGVAIRQDMLDSAVLHAVQDALESQVLEASVAKALVRVRADEQRFPDQRTSVTGELSLIETRLHHLVELVATGRCTEAVITALDEEETSKKSLVQELARLDELAQAMSLDEKRLTKQLLDRLGDLPALFGRHIPLARNMLHTLLEGRILCEPIEEDGKPGYRFTATGTFDRLLAGVSVLNDGGGGEGS